MKSRSSQVRGINSDAPISSCTRSGAKSVKSEHSVKSRSKLVASVGKSPKTTKSASTAKQRA
eukprot:21448-Eustigmatos_ZCMA.PRE.1